MSFHTPPRRLEDIDNLPTYSATDLTAGGDTAKIILDDKVYSLRITRAGKLILTK